MSLLSIITKALNALDLDDEVNRLVIDRTVNVCRNRPHPWSTKHDYISWSGLTDRTYNARLLPAKPPTGEGIGTSRPPLQATAALFARLPGTNQRLCPKSTGLFPAFAQYLTDGFIRTMLHNDDDKEDRRRTTSNHEIDLSPLYGRTEAQTRALRAGTGGRLKSQVINGEEYSPFLFGADGNVKPEFAILDLPLGLKNVTPAGKATLFAVGGDRVNAVPQTAMMNTLFLLNNSLLIGSGLAQSFVNTSANRTATLGLENAASFMMFAETGAINQARINNVASYNDYRLAMGMEPARNFAAIVGSSDTPAEQARLSALAKRLEGLYGDVNNVEYYIGLFAERVEKNGPLPELVSSMVAMDAFSQALTNPLLSEHVWGNPANKRLAFTDEGIKVIEQTNRLRDIVDRNAKGLGNAFVGMTRKEWKRAYTNNREA